MSVNMYGPEVEECCLPSVLQTLYFETRILARQPGQQALRIHLSSITPDLWDSRCKQPDLRFLGESWESEFSSSCSHDRDFPDKAILPAHHSVLFHPS